MRNRRFSRQQRAPQQPVRTHLSCTAKRTTSSGPAGDSSQPRTSPASSAQRSASLGAMWAGPDPP